MDRSTLGNVATDLTVLTSRRFQLFVEEERCRSGTQKSWEWFQWCEQLERHALSKTTV